MKTKLTTFSILVSIMHELKKLLIGMRFRNSLNSTNKHPVYILLGACVGLSGAGVGLLSMII